MRSIHCRVSYGMYILIQQGAEDVGASVAHFLDRYWTEAPEDALVDHFGEDVPHPGPGFERFNLCYGRLEGLEPEAQQALASVPDDD